MASKNEGEFLSVCFTGTCPGYSRAELTEMVEDLYEVKDSVTKDLDILVCEDPGSGSSKLQKAEKYGVKIMSYEDFLEIIENEDDEDSEEDDDSEEEVDSEDWDEDEEDENQLQDLAIEIGQPNLQINEKKVAKVEKAYGINPTLTPKTFFH